MADKTPEAEKKELTLFTKEQFAMSCQETKTVTLLKINKLISRVNELNSIIDYLRDEIDTLKKQR